MKHATWVAVAVLLALTGTACEDNWQSFFIQDNKRVGDPPECSIPTDENSEGLLGGVMDVSLTNSYAAYLFTKNALISREDPGAPDAESNGIFVQGVYLTFEPDPNVPVNYPPVEDRLTSYIPPQGSSTMGVWIIPSGTGAQMADALRNALRDYMTVIVTVQFYGATQAGTSVLSQEFRYPVYVCDGCLRTCPNDTSPGDGVCNCPVGGSEGDPPCDPGQDDLVDECLL